MEGELLVQYGDHIQHGVMAIIQMIPHSSVGLETPMIFAQLRLAVEAIP
jgi:hypothetical protein